MKTTTLFIKKEKYFLLILLFGLLAGVVHAQQPCPNMYIDVQTPACTGDVIFTAIDTAGGSTNLNGPYYYNWASGATTQSITIHSNTSDPIDAGVQVTNDDGCQQIVWFFDAVPNPAPTFSINGSDTICRADSAVLSLSKPDPGPFPLVTWKRGNVVLSQTGKELTVTEGGNYKATITGDNGCSATVTKKVVMRPKPIAAFTADGLTTFCAGGSVTFIANAITPDMTYQWKNNATIIPGATNPTYTATTAGKYRLIANRTFGCTPKTSGFVQVTINCREAGEAIADTEEDRVLIYPNPSSDEFTVETSGSSISVIDVTGRVVEQIVPENGTVKIGKKLAPGVYSVIIQEEGKMTTRKVVKQ